MKQKDSNTSLSSELLLNVCAAFHDHQGYDSFLNEKETLETIESLIDKGANVNSANKIKQSPLHFAAIDPKGSEAIKLLIERRAKINAKDKSGNTPLHLVGKLGFWATHLSTIDIFLKHKANPNIRNQEGMLPMEQILNTIDSKGMSEGYSTKIITIFAKNGFCYSGNELISHLRFPQVPEGKEKRDALSHINHLTKLIRKKENISTLAILNKYQGNTEAFMDDLLAKSGTSPYISNLSESVEKYHSQQQRKVDSISAHKRQRTL
jgi:hypothetical protein